MMERKYGRRPPKNAPALRLGDVLTGVVPVHPAEVDYLHGLSGWQMLGNSQYGDCVAVTWANVRRLVTAKLATEQYPDIHQVLELYKTQNPNFPQDDNGMDIQTCLEYLAKSGGPDGTKAICFAKVDHTNYDEVKAAIAIFGSVWTGITVLAANQTEFDQGQPWDYVEASLVDGGHSVITGGYGPPGTGALGGDERFITWARETSFTDRFWQRLAEEAWVVIWPEHLSSRAFLEGVDQAALASAYTALTGRPFPVSPIPIPVPAPTPVDVADHDLALAQLAWESHEDNLLRMRSCDKTLEAAQRAWRKAKKL